MTIGHPRRKLPHGRVRAAAVVTALPVGITVSRAEPPEWSKAFPFDQFSGSVHAMATFDADGVGPRPPGLYIAGAIEGAAGFAAPNSIVLWDGETFSQVGGGMRKGSTHGNINALAVFDADGAGPQAASLFAGGEFDSAGGLPVTNIARWDGVRWWPAGVLSVGRSPNVVAALSVFDEDGPGPALPRLFAGGNFTFPTPAVARWDGQIWTDVGGGLRGSVTNTVHALASFDEDGPGPGTPKLFAAGDFDAVLGGTPTNGLARWDGVSWTVPGSLTGLDGDGYALAVYDADGNGPLPASLFVGGQFGVAGGTRASSIASFDGSVWSAVGAGLSEGTGCRALTTLDPDGPGGEPGVLVAGGGFTLAGGIPCLSVAAWNGTAWSPVGGGVVGYASPAVRTLVTFDDDGPGGRGESLFAAGNVTNAGSTPCLGIAKWDAENWSALRNSVARPAGAPYPVVYAITSVGPSSSPLEPGLYIGGIISVVGQAVVSNIAVLSRQGWRDVGGGVIGTTRAIREFDADGNGPRPPVLVVGGIFSGAGGSPADNAALWDGSQWSQAGDGLDGEVRALALFDADGAGPAAPELVAAGRFLHSGPLTVAGVGSWDGARWAPLGSGLSAYGSALGVLDEDGPGPAPPSLVVGGGFTSAGGLPANHVARWRGGAWSALGPGIDGDVFALAVFDQDGAGPQPPTLYAGGPFTSAGGVPVSRFARWNGTAWEQTAFRPDDTVRAMAVFNDDGEGPALFVGGSFAGGTNPWRIARWNGQQAMHLGSGLSPGSACYSLGVHDDGRGQGLFVGGNFSLAGGVSSGSIARWGPSVMCYPDCDPSTGPGNLDIFDFLCFQNRYALRDPYACDCDTSTGPGVCDIFDFLCFQNAFDAGCP